MRLFIISEHLDAVLLILFYNILIMIFQERSSKLPTILNLKKKTKTSFK